jgi:hypothetical protein
MGERWFDANRDITVEASQAADGSYVLRTRGLSDQRRPELEVVNVPEVALQAAGGVINMLAEYTVNRAEVLADQTVGNVLAVGDDDRKLLLVVRAIAVEKPKIGLWSKISGGGKGVLRLVDAVGDEKSAPLTALATMLVHRAAVRLAKDDEEGAHEELEAAIATLPGTPGAGAPPSIGGASGTFNWQNHLAYLALAKLAGKYVHEAGKRFEEALARSDDLARAEVGAVLPAIAALDGDAIARAAKRVTEQNFAHVERQPGPTPALVILGSPVWEVDEDRAARRASLLPAALVELYYEGVAAERLTRDGGTLIAEILAGDVSQRCRAAWIARETRGLWISEEAPLGAPIGKAEPAYGIVSSVLADVARCFRAGATNEEILARYRGDVDGSEGITQKLIALETWEGEQYVKAMT